MPSIKKLLSIVYLLIASPSLLVCGQINKNYIYRFHFETRTKGLKYEGTDDTVVFRLMTRTGMSADDTWVEVCQDHKNRVIDGGWKKGIGCVLSTSITGWDLTKLMVEVHIEGTNAMMIDQAKLKKHELNGDLVEEKRFGVNNNKGWCFSEDPDDINGSWEDAAVGCYPALSFNGAGGVSTQPAETNHRKYLSYDTVCLDMGTEGAPDTVGTRNIVDFQLYDGNTLLPEVHRLGSTSWTIKAPQFGDFRSGDLECDDFPSTSSGSTGLKLKILGDDALLMDRLKMTRYGNEKNTLWWGADNDRGFCLSTDPNDRFGGFADGCHECIEFREEGTIRVCGTDYELND